MITEATVILLLFLVWGFWRYRKWLKSYWEYFKEQIVLAWDQKKERGGVSSSQKKSY